MYLKKLFAATAAEAADVTAHTFIFVAVAQEEDKYGGHEYAARAYLVDYARYAAATAATHDEQDNEQIQVIIIIAQAIHHRFKPPGDSALTPSIYNTVLPSDLLQ